MRTLTPIAPTLLSLVVLQPWSQTLDPRQVPASEKRLATRLHVSLEDLDLLVDGKDLGRLFFPGLWVTTDVDLECVVNDTFGPVVGTSPAWLERSFDRLSQELVINLGFEGRDGKGIQEELHRVVGHNELEGAAVLFTGELDELARTFVAGEPARDLALLAGLRMDLDLGCLLPAGEGAERGEWEVELEQVPGIVAPLGLPPWHLELEGLATLFGTGLDPTLMGELGDAIGGALAGEATATDEGRGGDVTRIGIEIDVESRRDTRELSRLSAELLQAELGLWSIEISSLRFDFDLEARGLASLDSGTRRLVGFELTGEFETYMEWCLDWTGGTVVELRAHVRGSFEQSIEVDARGEPEKQPARAD